MHIWQCKTQELPGPALGPWTPAYISSLHFHDSASLHRQNLNENFLGPPDQNPRSASEHITSTYIRFDNSVIDIRHKVAFSSTESTINS